jgi:pimeloyl-ACP methyl ester carboxylesterase
VESIAVDGHKIEFMRYGSGRPTVVFLQGGLGGGPGLNAWAPWLPRVGTAGFCYSRPGSGNSEPANDQRTPAQIIDELHALLGLAGVPPPYVLVGGSMGGLYARAFAMRYPHEVAGLVLIDGSHERQLIEFNRADPTRYPIPPIAEPDPAKVEFAGLASTMMSGHLDVGGTLPDVPMAVITALHHAGITPQLAKAANGSFSVHNLRYSYRDR